MCRPRDSVFGTTALSGQAKGELGAQHRAADSSNSTGTSTGTPAIQRQNRMEL
jgi:hypothetical protein